MLISNSGKITQGVHKVRPGNKIASFVSCVGSNWDGRIDSMNMMVAVTLQMHWHSAGSSGGSIKEDAAGGSASSSGGSIEEDSIEEDAAGGSIEGWFQIWASFGFRLNLRLNLRLNGEQLGFRSGHLGFRS